jgi:hypothetical protein
MMDGFGWTVSTTLAVRRKRERRTAADGGNGCKRAGEHDCVARRPPRKPLTR